MADGYEVSTANESTWVRSLYVYFVLLISGVAGVGGLVLAALSVVTLVNPQSGMSGWDRVLVGVPTVLDEGLAIAEDYLSEQRGELPDFCTPDLTEDDPDYFWCEDIRQELSEPVVPEEADAAIALVRDETLRQIRQGAIGRLVVGLVVAVVGAAVFLRHKRLAALYAKPGRAEPAPAEPPPSPPTL